VAASLSLARTAVELETARGFEVDAAAPASEYSRTPLATPWGAAELLPSPLTVGGHPLVWELPPRPLGSDDPSWSAQRRR